MTIGETVRPSGRSGHAVPRAPRRLHWTPALVNRFWNGFAQTRLVEHSFSRQGGRSLLVAIDHLLPRGGTILDFGAGDGSLVELLCARGFRSAAYEPSRKAAGRLRARLAGYETFRGVLGSSSKRAFDCILMVEVIEHILDEQLESSLRRLATLLRPGGVLVVTAPNHEDLELGMCYCPVSNALFHRWQHVRSFSRSSLVELLGGHGFEEVATHELEFSEALFVPYERAAGSPGTEGVPGYLLDLRGNRPVKIGSESNLLYVGRRKTAS